MKSKSVPLEQTIKKYFDQYGAILVGMHQDLQRQQAIVDGKLEDAKGRIASSVDQCAKATTHVEQMRDQLQIAMVNHHKMTETALKEYRVTNARQQELFDQRRTELLALHQQVINSLREINQKTEAHQLREAAFNKRLRQIVIGIVALAGIGVLAVMLWKP